MEITDAVLSAIVAEGIDHVFLVPGGLIDPFIGALAQNKQLTPIITCHEAGAAYMADGYSRARNLFGVCFCIGGPGITNTTTALAAALTDESALIVISGQVPTALEGRNTFQDSGPAATFNDMEIIRGVTTTQLVLEDANLITTFFHKLLSKACSAPQSPVHLVIAKNIQQTQINFNYQPITTTLQQERLLENDKVANVWQILSSAKNILIYAGAGIEKSNASASLKAFAENYQIPVATTLRAKGVFPEDHPLALGVFGYSGTRRAIETLLSDQVDVLLVLGSGLNERDTLFWDEKFAPKVALIQVDINPDAIGTNYETQLRIVSDCRALLDALLATNNNDAKSLINSVGDRQQWLKTISTIPLHYQIKDMTSDAMPIHPARVITDLRKVMPRETILVVDSGAHRAFAGHYWQSYHPLEYISATNLGPMGWGIPASIGAKFARPDQPVVLITGDGCMLMHGIEIHTAKRYGANVIFVVLNNHALGNVYLRAKLVSKEAGEMLEIPGCDFKAFAEAFGLQAIRVTEPSELIPAFQKALNANAPCLIDVICGKDYTTPVAPFTEAQHEWHE